MKFFAFILSFYLLALTCYPCSDSQQGSVKTEQKISASANHQGHKQSSEACTPFCSCSCCAASAFYSPFSKAQVNKIEFRPGNYPLYNVSFSTEAHNSIWQPPKLS